MRWEVIPDVWNPPVLLFDGVDILWIVREAIERVERDAFCHVKAINLHFKWWAPLIKSLPATELLPIVRSRSMANLILYDTDMTFSRAVAKEQLIAWYDDPATGAQTYRLFPIMRS